MATLSVARLLPTPTRTSADVSNHIPTQTRQRATPLPAQHAAAPNTRTMPTDIWQSMHGSPAKARAVPVATPLDDTYQLPYQIPLDPGRQAKALAQVYGSDPLFQTALDLDRLSALFNKPSSNAVTRGLLGYYEAEHQLSKQIGVDSMDLSNIFFKTVGGQRNERFDYSDRVSKLLDGINGHLSPSDHQKLLQHLFGSGIQLAKDIGTEHARALTLGLVGAARNSQPLLDALKQLSGDRQRVEFGTLNEADPELDFRIDPDADDPNAMAIRVAPKNLASEDEAIQLTGYLIQKALEVKQGILPSQSKAKALAEALDPDAPRIRGLLNPRLALSQNEPILRLRFGAQTLQEVAEDIDTIHHSSLPDSEKEGLLKDLMEIFITVSGSVANDWNAAFKTYLLPKEAPTPGMPQQPTPPAPGGPTEL